MSDTYPHYESDDDFDDEDEDGFEFECGAFINGRFDYSACRLAGTEDCDWECPYSAGARGLRGGKVPGEDL